MRIYPHTWLAELAAREGVIARTDLTCWRFWLAYYIAPTDLEEVASAATGKAWFSWTTRRARWSHTLRWKRNA